MRESTKGFLNDDLENMEKKFSIIAFSDPEKYNEFLSILKALQNDLLGASEIELERKKAEIVARISTLEAEFDSYMDGTTYSPVNALRPDVKIESGKSKLRKYKIDLYSSIISDLKKLDFINIQDIDKLLFKWDEDKNNEDFEFSPFELSSMEEKISGIFLEYQIKFLQSRGVFPKELITNYTSLEEYQNRIKDKLVEASQRSVLSPQKKLELDSLFNEEDLKKLLSNPSLWEIIANKQFSLPSYEASRLMSQESEKISEEHDEETEKNANDNLPIVVAKRKTSTTHMICTIKKTNRLFNKGKVSYKQVKVKIRNGIVNLPKKYRDSIVEAFIPEGAECILDSAFCNCQNLVEVSLPNSIKSIGEGAFKSCLNLKKMDLPEGLKNIGDQAFYFCHELQNIAIPSTVTDIGNYSFYACKGLKELKLPENLQNLGSAAFSLCENLERVDFPKNFTYIPSSCFANCSKLSQINFSNNLEKIQESAFIHCTGLTNLTNFPNTLRIIEKAAFWDCTNIKTVRVPESLRKVEKDSFLHSLGLTDIYMPRILGNTDIPLAITRNPNAVLHIPENPEGDFYEQLGITSSTNLTMEEYRKKLVDFKEQQRNKYLQTFYGKETPPSVANTQTPEDSGPDYDEY